MVHAGSRTESRTIERESPGRWKRHVLGALAASFMALALVGAWPVAAQDAAAVPTPCDFVTSGGFVYADSGKKANFGAHGGCKNGEFWGHVNFVDHTTGYHVNSLEVTGYLTPSAGSNVRDICGIATTNAAEIQPVFFRVRLVDNGNGVDQFGIRLSTGYTMSTRFLAAGGPGGGKVQLHDPNPSTTPPTPVPDLLAMCNGVPEPSAPSEEE